MVWDPDNPYRWRTWIRGHLPWFLLDLGVASKGEDCESAGGEHHWYNRDDRSSGCYHCEVVRPGRWWHGAAAEGITQSVHRTTVYVELFDANRAA